MEEVSLVFDVIDLHAEVAQALVATVGGDGISGKLFPAGTQIGEIDVVEIPVPSHALDNSSLQLRSQAYLAGSPLAGENCLAAAEDIEASYTGIRQIKRGDTGDSLFQTKLENP